MKYTVRNLKSIEYVTSFFPSLKKHLEGKAELDEKKLNNVELTFLKMCRFFLNPKGQSFDFRLVYNNLQDEWVVTALTALKIFTREDTYLIKKPSHMTHEVKRTRYIV